ncbi:MAG TPA: hypothetical protein VG711_02105, partial [Phycisphaerales bacterium]|nr:hypothetical protein [Phycisphaerales bacterium]
MRSAAKSTWYGAAFTKRAAALAAAGIVGFSDGRAMAQQVSDTHIPNASHSQDLKEVDQGFGDEGPLRTSLRDFSVDLRLPTGFQKVYQVPGREDELMRVSGGLIAVFPRSVYATGRGGGQLPLIPPGTVYYIGGIELFPRAVGPTGDSS